MRRVVLFGSFVALGWLGSGSVFAQVVAQVEGPKVKQETKPPVEIAAPTPVCEKTIPRRETYLVPQEQATCIENLSLREIEACRRKVTDYQLDFKETTHVGTEIVLKPKEVEQEVICHKTEAVQGTDCHGNPCTTYKQVPVVHKVTVTVYEPVREKREFIVRSPIVRAVESEMIVKKLVLDRTEEPAIRRTFKAVQVEEQIKVPIYQLPPLPPRCPTPCATPAPCCGK